MVSRIALGLPGKLMIRALPRSPAVCLDKTAVGTYLQCRVNGEWALRGHGLDGALSAPTLD